MQNTMIILTKPDWFAMEGDIGDKDFLEQFVRSSTEYFNDARHFN